MSYAIAVSSKTGNTRLVADGLEREFGRDVVYFGGIPRTPDDLSGAENVLVGFWTDKGTCDGEVASFLAGLHGKRVFLFGTAGFGGSRAYFEQIASRAAENLAPDSELVGWEMCQGRMSPAVRERFERMLEQNPGDARAQAMVDNFDRALEHPNEADVQAVADAARRAFGA